MKKAFLFLGVVFALSACTDNQAYELAPGIFIMDKKQAIESFDELSSRMEGKPFYLDRWASWCSPCIEEFGHVEALHAFLSDNQIEMVYLNSDGDIDEDAWFDFIIEHKLKGYHLNLDSTLKADMASKLIFIPIIPQYMIVGQGGELINKDALRPSDGEELYDQLRNALNIPQ